MKPDLIEVFFRDGSYALDFGLTRCQMEVIGGAMEAAGFPYVEIGHGYGLGAARKGFPPAAETDETYLAAARSVFKNTRYGTFFIPGVGTPEDMKMAHGHGISFISIGQNITAVEEARPAVELAKELGLHTTVCMMKAHVLPLPEFTNLVSHVQSWGPDCICIMDSAGTMVPAEVQERVTAVCRSGPATAGFHGHNNLSLAVANSLAAFTAGAGRIDVSLGGIGRSAGNTATEALTALLRRMGRETSPSLEGVEAVLESAAMEEMPLGNAPAMDDILLGIYGLHSSISGIVETAVERHGVPAARLYEAVARHNPVNPTPDEIERLARELKGDR
ncbi:MAG: hypothetical protein HZA04_00825 [Nitrospinae bacterium]|nr:hypothetical protein [Nitrospinota bacterium]